MGENIIYTDEYIKIFCEADAIYIETFKKGYSFEKLNSIFSMHPEIDITSYNVLKAAINSAPKLPEKFARLKERIIINTIENDLKAIIIFNLSLEELDLKNRENLIKESSAKLREKGIAYGIKKELFFEEIQNGKSYIIAEGVPPINGIDSVIRMYELKELIPEVHDDGKVNFYELKLINRVNVDDWLGERIDATNGIPGQSVTNMIIKPFDGKTLSLYYDKNTVKEVSEDGKTTLYSRINGAVNYIGDKLVISNHLEIDGDVDFKTGNIKFDGYITVKGTVSDGFSLEATKDIEINGQLGVGNVKEIISTHGSIFIKGGIASKGKAEIKAGKDVFVKFVDNTSVTCGGTVHIGFYCINSSITAKEVLLDSIKGQIIGGSIKSEVRVVAPIIGSEREKRTLIEVTGFDRVTLKQELIDIVEKLNDLKNEQQKVKQTLSALEGKGQLNPFQRREHELNFGRMVEIKDEVKALEDKKKSVTGYLKTRGDGEIYAAKRIFPNCMLAIKKRSLEISTATLATCLFIQDGEIKQV